MNPATKLPLLNDKQYAWLKNLSMVVLPGIGTLYLTVATIWGLPKGDAVAGTCVALATFVGLFLKLAESSYDHSDAVNHVGAIQVNSSEDGTTYVLDIGETDPAVIDRSGKVLFDVQPGTGA